MPIPLPGSALALARIAGLLSIAAFAGSAITHAVASRLLVSDDALAAVATLEALGLSSLADPELDAKAEARERRLEAALAAQAETEAQARTERITRLNIFCPDCQPARRSDGTDGSEPGDGEPAMALTQLPLALVATMESEEPIDSLATIRDTESLTTGLFGVGDPVRPGVIVAGIQRGTVVLRGRGGLQTLEFPDPHAPAPEPEKPEQPKQPTKKSSREIDGAREAIDCRGNACTVDRAFVEKLMRNPRMLARQAKLIPAVEDGQTRGFRVYRALEGTLPQLLGLENGDTLLAVNGNDLDSMDEAISLYTKLRRASELSLTVEREGEVFAKQISIR